MSDTLKGQEPTEGTVTPVPSENKPAEEAQLAEAQLPDGVKERTAAEFEKLKQNNKALAEKVAALEGNKAPTNSVLDELRPSNGNIPTEPVVPQLPQNFVDDGGYVDTALLNAKLAEANKKADEANRVAKQTQESIERFQETEEVQRVHAQFAQVDPNNVEAFNQDFYDRVKLELLNQTITSGKRDFMAACEKVNKLYPSTNSAEAIKQQETISKREQASTSTGASKGSSLPVDHDTLVAGTRQGNADAIYKRLLAAEGH